MQPPQAVSKRRGAQGASGSEKQKEQDMVDFVPIIIICGLLCICFGIFRIVGHFAPHLYNCYLTNIYVMTQYSLQYLPTPPSRIHLVNHLFHIKENLHALSRDALCLAISILDKCLHSAPFLPPNCSNGDDDWEFPIACMGIAIKFLDGDKFAYSSLLKVSPLDLDHEPSIIQMEISVMKALEWRIPSVTALQHFEQSIIDEEFQKDSSRKRVALSLKMLMTAYSLGPEVSLEPKLGAQIHLITTKRRGWSKKALSVFERSKEQILRRFEKIRS